jgi:signal peptidase I
MVGSEGPSVEAPEDDLSTDASSRRHRRRRVVIEWVAIVVVAVVVSFLMRTYVLQTFYIPSGSMEPTLQLGDRIIVSKLSVDFGTVHTGDIIVFKAPPAEHCGDTVSDLVKRVIGTPGEKIYNVGNTIFINGKALKETWTHNEPVSPAIATRNHPVTVGANQYFVMGDNHPNSCDSRFWGTVPRSNIVGKVFLRIWPLTRFSFL